MLKHRVLSLLNAFWAIPVVFFIRAVRPLRLIRIGQIFSGRIGHFVPDSIEHLIRPEFTKKATLDYFYFFGGVSNTQWAKMVSRKLNVKGSWLRFIWHWNDFIPGGEVHSLPQSFTSSRDPQGLMEKSKTRFEFYESEEVICKKWLASKGWKDGEKFVCLQVRDSLYLAEFDPANPGDKDQVAHSYRDSDIESYIPAIDWLISEGFWVIRMGKIAKISLPQSHERVIDYAFDSSKSDLLDVWLFANCTFTISTSSGPDWISIAYGKPVLLINALPLGFLFSFANSMYIPKNLFWGQDQRQLTFGEILKTVDYDTLDYKASDILVQDLTSAEILEGVKEFWEWVSESGEHNISFKSLQEIFWVELKKWERYHEFHGYIHEKTCVSNRWLESRPKDFFDL